MEESEKNIENPLLGDTKKMTENQLEHFRLAGRPPLSTILHLSIGPMVSQVVGALYSIVDTIWVSRACGDRGMAAVSTYNCFDNIGRSFGFFLCTAASQKTSQLFGQHKTEEIAQIYCDLMRCTIICGLIVPAILIPTVRPCARWFGAEESLVQYGFQYIAPLCWGSVGTCVFLCNGGFLQGEGRTHVFAMMELFSFFLNGLLFDPFLLLYGKLGVRGAAISTLCAEIIPALMLFGWYMKGAFAVKPQWRGFIRKFSPHTWSALKVGLSQLFANLSFFVPTILVRKLIGLSVPEGEFDDAFAGYNVTIRFSYLTNAVFQAINQGFLPAGSYANGAKKYKRWLWLVWHAIWINFLWGGFTCILTWTIPRELSMMFSTTEGYLKWAGPMMRYRNALGFFAFGRFNCQAILQSLQKGGRATLLSILAQFFAIAGFSLLMYVTDKHDAVRLMWCYPLTDTFGITVGALFCASSVWDMFKKARQEDNDNSKSQTVDSIMTYTN